MNFITDPRAIEDKSMEIIAPHLAALDLTAEETKIYSRIIHAAGDVEYAPLIRLHPQAIAAAKNAIANGTDIFTDVEMVKTGINKRKLAEFGGEVKCLIADEETARMAKAAKITRAMASMRRFGKELDGAIVAVGNAPTALFEVLRLVSEEAITPAVVVGIPVGFVGAAEAKKALAAQSKIPFVTVEGTKGGSSIAAAVVNAVMYILNDARG